MDRIAPSSYYGYSSDYENETNREESSSRSQPGSSGNSPTRIPDGTRRALFATDLPTPERQSMRRSAAGRFETHELARPQTPQFCIELVASELLSESDNDEPSAHGSVSGHFQPEELMSPEDLEMKKTININKAAEKMLVNESVYSGIMKQFTKKGMLPPAIIKEFKLSPDEFARCIKVFNTMRKEVHTPQLGGQIDRQHLRQLNQVPDPFANDSSYD